MGGAYGTSTEIGEIVPSQPMAGEPVRVHVSVSACLPPFHVCVGISTPIVVSDTSDPSTTCTTGAFSGDCTLEFHSSGTHTLTAVYPGSDSMEPSTGYRTLTVGPRVLTLADGVTGPFFDTYLLLANPGATSEPVTLSLSRVDAVTAETSTVVPPHARITLRADDLPALTDTAFTATVTVPSGHPLFVERATYFATDYRAGDAASARRPTYRAFFAEGCQNSVFDTYLLIGNPNPDIAYVLVSFLVDGGEAVHKTYAALPGGRLAIATARIPELAGRSFGIDVNSSVRVAVERSMYFAEGYLGGHSESGVSPSTTWLFAEGVTGSFFDTFLLLANPAYNERAAQVTVTYHPGSGRIVSTRHLIPENGRVTVDVEREDPVLADTTLWVEIASDAPIVAERAMYWASDGGPRWTEGHVSAGATAAAPRWGFAEGIVGGGLEFKTFLLVANPGPSPVTVDVEYLPTGIGPITRVHTVPAGARLTVDVEADVPALRDVPFGATVTARSGGLIVAERSIYWTRHGPVFLGGTNAGGTPF